MAKSTLVTDEQLAQVRDNMKSLDTLDNEIRLAKLAGFDVTQAEERSKDLRSQLSKINNVYGPKSV